MSEPYVIKMPQLSDTMTEGVVVSWEKEIGAKLERGDIVATVETDKAIMDVEVFRDGYLSAPLADVDSVVLVGGAIGHIVDSADEVQQGGAIEVMEASQDDSHGEPIAASVPIRKSSEPQAAPLPSGKSASPYARKLALVLGVDLINVTGSGPNDAITGDDVISAAPTGGGVATAVQSAVAAPAVPGNGRAMNAMEKAISQSMTASLSMPTFHVTINASPGALIKASKKSGISVTVTIAKACALAMQKHPRMNWAYQPQDKLVERSNVDIGMAVSTEDGLVVPVLRNCESATLEDLNSGWKGLVDRARSRRLSPDEYANPTFMVSNMGMMGVAHFDAIPTPGIAAILAISTAGEQGMPLTITADHRVVNGADAAAYLATLKQFIEQPADWMGPIGSAIPEGDWDYDVVVIGGGPGGEDCARHLSEHGVKVAMINDSPFPGGECLWRGCIPSKTWRAAADRLRDRNHDEHLGIEGNQNGSLAWAKLEKTRRWVLDTRGEMALKTDTGVKIKVIQGFARFDGEHTLFVDTSGNSKDPHNRAPQGDGSAGQSISFGCAVIATGAPPFIPPIPGAHDAYADGGVLTSDNVWGLDKVPASLAVVGGGAIGVEMAQIFQDFGSDVALFEAQERILAEVEPEIAKSLTTVLNNDPRLTIHTRSQIKAIKGKPGAMVLDYQDSDGNSQTFACDYVMMATGKRPAVAPLQLDKAGIDTDGPVIKANAYCATSAPHIFAVGDVIGGLMLAHTAGQQGRVAASAILGEAIKYDQDKDCGVIFTRPQAAFVGLSMEQAKAKGIDAAEIKVPMSIDAKAMISGETDGMIKIVADKKSERIIGVHLLVDHADTLIGEAVLMVSCGLTLEQVGGSIHPHPTQTELFGDLARRLASRLRRSKKRKA